MIMINDKSNNNKRTCMAHFCLFINQTVAIASFRETKNNSICAQNDPLNDRKSNYNHGIRYRFFRL